MGDLLASTAAMVGLNVRPTARRDHAGRIDEMPDTFNG